MKIGIFFVALMTLFLSCANQPFDMWSGEPDYKLGLPEISISEKEKVEFLNRLNKAQLLFEQYKYWSQLDSLYSSEIIDTNAFVLFLNDAKEPSFVLGIEDQGFKIKNILTKNSKWELKYFAKPIEIEGVTKQYQRLIKAWRAVDSEDSLNFIPLALNQDSSIYFTLLGSKTKGVLGGGKEFVFAKNNEKNKILSYGEPSEFDKLEVRHFNFQIANGDSNIPAVLDFLDVLKYQDYFPSHYLHTGPYIFAYVSIKGALKTWKVLDPSVDDRYKLKVE